MAIGAALFVWVRGRENWLDDARLRRLSYLLTSTDSREKFVIPARLPSALPNAGHALEPCERDEKDRPVWTLGDPEIVGGVDDQFIHVNLMSLYYDESYSRGDWPTIRWVSEWLDLHFPGCAVYYGGDSGGKPMRPLTARRREEINRHFLENGRRQGLRQLAAGFAGNQFKAPVCDICGVEPWRSGGSTSGDRVFYTCDGCGRQWLATAHGIRRLSRDGRSADARRDMRNSPEGR